MSQGEAVLVLIFKTFGSRHSKTGSDDINIHFVQIEMNSWILFCHFGTFVQIETISCRLFYHFLDFVKIEVKVKILF